MSDAPFARMFKKRFGFYQSMDWQQLQQLLIDSGMLKFEASVSAVTSRHEGPVVPRLVVDHERTGAMLALTAIHDVRGS